MFFLILMVHRNQINTEFHDYKNNTSASKNNKIQITSQFLCMRVLVPTLSVNAQDASMIESTRFRDFHTFHKQEHV